MILKAQSSEWSPSTTFNYNGGVVPADLEILQQPEFDGFAHT